MSPVERTHTDRLGGNPPSISVVIPTRDRPLDVQRCLASLRTVRYPQWDITIVDQSDDERTREVLSIFQPLLPTLKYLRAAEKGISRARNRGIGATTGQIIAFLDDDCTVEATWLENVAAPFTRYDDLALVCGSVRAVPVGVRLRWVPSLMHAGERLAHGRLASLDLDVMGASMYVRRSAVAHIGMFDPLLGLGSTFRNGREDYDYVYRTLAQGYSVLTSLAISVLHHGMRGYGWDADRYRRHLAFTRGGYDMKLLRSGEWLALWLIVHRISDLLGALQLRAARRLLRQGRVGKLLALLPLAESMMALEKGIAYGLGLRASFRYPIERQQILYREIGDESGRGSEMSR